MDSLLSNIQLVLRIIAKEMTYLSLISSSLSSLECGSWLYIATIKCLVNGQHEKKKRKSKILRGQRKGGFYV